MSRVRVLVGTHKGAFILSADGKRDRWEVLGPYFPGCAVSHVTGSPGQPNRLYASQTGGAAAPQIQRSETGGIAWESLGTMPMPVHQVAASPADADVVYASGANATLFRSADRGGSWDELAGPSEFGSQNSAEPAMLLDPSNAE